MEAQQDSNRRREFPLTLYDDHVLFPISLATEADAEPRELIVLIDTGAGTSASSSLKEISFFPDGEKHTLLTKYLGKRVEELSELVGTKFDVLVGCDVLAHYMVSLSYSNKKLVLSRDIPPSQE